MCVCLEPKLFLLGIYPPNRNIRKKHGLFLDTGLLLAKRVIALALKDVDRPRKGRWFSELTATLPVGKITYAIRGETLMFENIWGLFVKFLAKPRNDP